MPENCTSIEYMRRSLTGPAPFSNFFGAPTSYGHAMLSKTMYSYEFSAREAARPGGGSGVRTWLMSSPSTYVAPRALGSSRSAI